MGEKVVKFSVERTFLADAVGHHLFLHSVTHCLDARLDLALEEGEVWVGYGLLFCEQYMSLRNLGDSFVISVL